MHKIKAAILYNQLTENAGPDEADVLAQVAVVGKMLQEFNVEVLEEQFSLSLDDLERRLFEIKPDFVFNLVESVNNKGSLIYFSPAILTAMGIPFTGAGLEPMFITTSKPLAKERMQAHGIATSPWFYPNETHHVNKNKKYIVKPVWEEGSLGLDEDSVFEGNDAKLLQNLKNLDARDFFVEEFIDGREFNLSVLAGENGPQVLPPAEIVFTNYPKDKPKVVGFSAKWREDSFEYKNTSRTFSFSQNDEPLLNLLKSIALSCWKVFRQNGYARVDFRVNAQGIPYVLEVNANPCISPDSGFFAACAEAGIPFREAVRRIVNDTPNLKFKI